MICQLTNQLCLNCGVICYIPRYAIGSAALCPKCARELQERLANESAQVNEDAENIQTGEN